MKLFDPAATLQIIHDERATHMDFVPTHLVAMLNIPDLDKYDISSFDKSAYLVSTKPTIGKFDSEVHEMEIIDKLKDYGNYGFTL